MIEKTIDEDELDEIPYIDISERFSNDYRCPIIDYKIENVKDGSKNQYIDESTYSVLFQIDELG